MTIIIYTILLILITTQFLIFYIFLILSLIPAFPFYTNPSPISKRMIFFNFPSRHFLPLLINYLNYLPSPYEGAEELIIAHNQNQILNTESVVIWNSRSMENNPIYKVMDMDNCLNYSSESHSFESMNNDSADVIYLSRRERINLCMKKLYI